MKNSEIGTGKDGQPIYGNAALLSNVSKKGGWDKYKRTLIRKSAIAGANAAIAEYENNVTPIKKAAKPKTKSTAKLRVVK
ncbi:hypothetical protein U0D24_21875 [Hafnia paralvei]|uniref:hypothetical protein n=1 Tax=Hafnia paralvei TaxID=546367 RepID=UPI002FDC0619